ncbi:hypothetical protein Hanom_Chr05g00441061 [Helianthus anomalus]
MCIYSAYIISHYGNKRSKAYRFIIEKAAHYQIQIFLKLELYNVSVTFLNTNQL